VLQGGASSNASPMDTNGPQNIAEDHGEAASACSQEKTQFAELSRFSLWINWAVVVVLIADSRLSLPSGRDRGAVALPKCR
jgi:hypothetical protein